MKYAFIALALVLPALSACAKKPLPKTEFVINRRVAPETDLGTPADLQPAQQALTPVPSSPK
jgi:hypothetical protein